MPDCNETLREMYQYLDGEMPPTWRGALQSHLDGCLDCLGAFEFHVELRTLIAKKCRDEVPEGLRQRILDCFGEEATGGTGSFGGSL